MAMAAAVDIPWLTRREDEENSDGHPNKRRLETVAEFFQYTEQQGVVFCLNPLIMTAAAAECGRL
jgi:hypothetical protein